MTATKTIERLKKSLAEESEVVRKLSVLNKALRAANPEMAQVIDERESLRRMVAIYEEEVEKLTKTVGGALLKALESTPGPFTATVGRDDVTLKSGAGTWAPQLSVEKVRVEDEATEVRRAANRLALEGVDNVALLKATEARKKRERGGR